MPAIHRVPVLIVGGGPVGMMLALQLERFGVPVMLVNSDATPRHYPKGSTHNTRTMEHFRRLGIAAQIRSLGLPHDHPTDVGYFTRLTAWELARLPMPSESQKAAAIAAAAATDQIVEPMLRANQMYVEDFVFAHLRSRTTINPRYGWTVTGYADDGEHVQVDIVGPEGTQERIATQYLVGCDGGQSMVRKQLGIRYSGEGLERQAYLGGAMATAHLRAPGFYAAMPHSNCWQYWTVNTEVRSNIVCLNGVDEFLFQTQLRENEEATADLLSLRFTQCLGKPLAREVLGIGTWTPGQALVADAYGHGRVLLCGDAVHLFTPTGGFGLNTGIDDAVNLGWKLAARVNGWGGPGLLASYELERRPVGFRNTAMAKNLTRNVGKVPVDPVMEKDSFEGAAARAATGAVLANFAEEYASYGIQLGMRYADSPVVAHDGASAPADDPAQYIPSAVPGGRAPHIWLGQGQSLYDLLGDGFTLLAFGNATGSAAPLVHAAATRGVPLTLLPLQHAKGRDLYQRDFAIIRPDNHTAWRGNTLPADCGTLLDRITGW